MGPARNWPFTQDYDVIPLKDFLRHGENMLAVLVNFYGESTSQYVHGRGGLLAQLDLLKAGEAVGQVVTGSDLAVGETRFLYRRIVQD